MSDRKRSKKMTFLAASAAGLLAIAGAMGNAAVVYADVQCAGVNACKGQGECGGKGHDCAGKNGCKGAGWVHQATEADCITAGGTVVPSEPIVDAPAVLTAAPVTQ